MRANRCLLVMFLISCSTATNLDSPKVTIEQTSPVASLRMGIEGGVPVDYRLRINNPQSEPLTLTSVEIETMGDAGAYSLRRVQHRFDRVVPARGSDELELRAWVRPLQDTEKGDVSNPVILRGIARFATAEGKEIRTSFTNRVANP